MWILFVNVFNNCTTGTVVVTQIARHWWNNLLFSQIFVHSAWPSWQQEARQHTTCSGNGLFFKAQHFLCSRYVVQTLTVAHSVMQVIPFAWTLFLKNVYAFIQDIGRLQKPFKLSSEHMPSDFSNKREHIHIKCMLRNSLIKIIAGNKTVSKHVP